MPQHYKPTILDYALSKTNPWGLTASQCSLMRMKCEMGMSKIVAVERGVTIKTVERQLEMIRAKMGYPGADIRLFLVWHDWYQKEKDRFK